MCTSDPHIYAVGECVEHRGQVFGLVAPLWDMAKICADRITDHGTDSSKIVERIQGAFKQGLLSEADVDAAVRHLVDNVFNKGGKLILDCAFGIPDETPVENVRAMFTAARKYGG